MSEGTPNAGHWQALIGDEVVGTGHTAEEALQLAQAERPHERPILEFVDPPDGEPLNFASALNQIRPLLIREQPVFLVGGAIRDALLGGISRDLDFVVPEAAIQLAFEIANKIDAAVYVLDRERDTGRVVIPSKETMLDFARYRGPDILADLWERDFTVNALALPAGGRTREAIIDPTGGLKDIEAGVIRVISDNTLTRDPVRTLRAVRLAASLDFHISEGTKTAISAAGPGLIDISAERKRDELLKMLMTARAEEAVGMLSDLGLLQIVLPEVANLSAVAQSPPHFEDALSHTLRALGWTVQIDLALVAGPVENAAIDSINVALGPYRDALKKHLERGVDGGVDGSTILRLAALFHDVGKGVTGQVDEKGRIHFLGHDEEGAAMAGVRLRQLALSREAIKQVKRIVAGHMRPLSLAQAQGAHPSRRAVFRYFRTLDSNGLDVALLALADHLATYDGEGDAQYWESLTGLAAQLCDFYFNRHEQTVKPSPLLSGRDLIELLGMEQGPAVGRILRLIEEGQAAGEITSREEALRLAGKQIE